MKMTKKAIYAALRDAYKAKDRTALFKLYYTLTGVHGKSNDWNTEMRKYFEPFCTSVRMARSVGAMCDTKYLSYMRNYQFDRVHLEFYGERPRPGIAELTRRERATALSLLRRLYEEPVTNYTKVPMFGMTHLYFCSPSYGHSDYNKVRTCLLTGELAKDAQGNSYDPQAAWCRKVVELGNRIFDRKKYA